MKFTFSERDEIIQDFISGRKTQLELAEQWNITIGSIKQMVFRYRQKNTILGDIKRLSTMSKKLKTTNISPLDLMRENEELKRKLQLAQLKIEGYEIMGDILEQEYGIDMLKKSVAKPSQSSKKLTKK